MYRRTSDEDIEHLTLSRNTSQRAVHPNSSMGRTRHSSQELELGVFNLMNALVALEQRIGQVARHVENATYKQLQALFIYMALDYSVTQDELDRGYQKHMEGRGYVGALERSQEMVQQLQTFIESIHRKSCEQVARSIKYIHKEVTKLHKQVLAIAFDHNEVYVDVSTLLGSIDDAEIKMAHEAVMDQQEIDRHNQQLMAYQKKRHDAEVQAELGAGVGTGVGIISAALSAVVPHVSIVVAAGAAGMPLYAAAQKGREKRQEHHAQQERQKTEEAEATRQQALDAIKALKDTLLPCVKAFRDATKSIADALNNIASDTKRFSNISSMEDLAAEDLEEFQFMHSQLESIAANILRDCKQLIGVLPRLQTVCKRLESVLPVRQSSAPATTSNCPPHTPLTTFHSYTASSSSQALLQPLQYRAANHAPYNSLFLSGQQHYPILTSHP